MSALLPRVPVSRLLVAVLLAALCLLGGCSNKAQRLYQRAEMFFAQGQSVLAATEYRRLAVEQPRSSLADDALYKLAYLYREEFDRLPWAIQTYQLLADRYPSSPYADDALLWVLQIQGQRQKNPTAVRRTCALIRDRYAGDERVLAAAQLQLVKTLFTCGLYEQADREAQALISQFPANERQCAAALLTRARVREKLGKPGDDSAVKLYEQVVAKYPDTPGATEAKRAIGWLYYGYKNTELAAQRAAQERAARVLSGVPAPVLVGPDHLKPFAALSALLDQRGVKVSPEELLVTSGAAFVFAYDPERPRATTSLLERGALIAAAEQYGFATNVWSAPAADGSFASLAQSIGEGRPVMLPQSGGGNWLIVTGYRPAEDRVYVLLPGQSQPQALSRQALVARWSRAGQGHTAVVTGPYFQLSLGERGQAPGATALLKTLARQAVSAMNESERRGTAVGDHAYALLADQLTALDNTPEATRLQSLQQWVNAPLPQFLSERRAAAEYLAEAGSAAGGATADHATQAATALHEMVRVGMELRRELLSLLKPSTGAEPPPMASWPETAERVRQMQAADQKALSHLSEIAR